MNSLKNTREKLSLGQQEIAQWLGITPNQEEQYEQGTGTLPPHAMIQLARLESMILQIETGYLSTADLNGSNGTTGTMPTLSDKRKLERIQHTIKLQKQLLALQARYASLAQQLSFVTQLMKDSEIKSEKELRWLKMVYWQLATMQSKCNEGKQFILKGKILRLQMELEMMNK